MLTKKELLSYKKSKGDICPQFINPEEEKLKNFASLLSEFLKQSIGKTRKELEEEVASLMQAFEGDPLVAQGLQKLVFDRMTFETSSSASMSAWRHEIFQVSFASLSQAKDLELKEFQEIFLQEFHRAQFELPQGNSKETNIKENLSYGLDNLQSNLYSDLPEYNHVTEYKTITENDLLKKYNTSLVQGFLFHCDKVTIKIKNFAKHKAQLRTLLRAMKFFQLVLSIQKCEQDLLMELDGPLSLFTQTQKYGFNLACFFPTLLHMPQWELSAFIQLGKGVRQQGTLHLTEKSPLIPRQKNFSAYIPEEFQLFYKRFSELKSYGWLCEEECDDFLFDGEQFFFPDFKFSHSIGETIYAELFHAWHRTAVVHRLHALAKHPVPFKLIVGISKSLFKDAGISAEIEKFQGNSSFIFVFRDVLPTEEVLGYLLSIRKQA